MEDIIIKGAKEHNLMRLSLLKIIIILCLLCAIVYGNSLFNGFVLDDKALIVFNPAITSVRFLPGFFSKGIFDYYSMGRQMAGSQVYRPLQMLTYFIDYKLSGLNAFWFHFSSLLWHLGNGILVFFILLFIFKNRPIAFLASVLFLVHPLNTSVVSYIAGRADLLSGFFILLCLLLFLIFLQRRQTRYFLFSFGACLLALFSRENALIIPLFLVVILAIQKQKPRNYLLLLPFLLLEIGYGLWRFILWGRGGVSLYHAAIPLPLRIINFANCLALYAKLFFIPENLHFQRLTPLILDLTSNGAIVSLFCIFLGALIGISIRKNKILFFGFLWSLASLIPVLFCFDGYLLLGGAMMAESWAYLFTIGLSLICARIIIPLRIMWLALLACFIIFLGLLTIGNNFYWRNDFSLLKRTLEFSSGKNPLRRNLINEYLYYGLIEDARAEIEIYRRYYPADTPELNEAWGSYYCAKGSFPQAIEHYSIAHAKNKDFFLSYQISRCFKKMDNPDKAIKFGLESFQLNPYFILNLIQLGDLYRQKNQLAEADKFYRCAFAVNPHNKILKELVKDAK